MLLGFRYVASEPESEPTRKIVTARARGLKRQSALHLGQSAFGILQTQERGKRNDSCGRRTGSQALSFPEDRRRSCLTIVFDGLFETTASREEVTRCGQPSRLQETLKVTEWNRFDLLFQVPPGCNRRPSRPPNQTEGCGGMLGETKRLVVVDVVRSNDRSRVLQGFLHHLSQRDQQLRPHVGQWWWFWVQNRV